MNAHVKLDKAGMDRVKGRYNQTVPMFGGNERVPVLSQVSIDHVVQLVNGATTDNHIRRAAMGLLGLMETKDWCISCGVHQGGLGGAFGEADPEPHVILSVGTVGYHLRVLKKNNRYVLYDITGGGMNAPVSAGRAQRRKRASPPKQNWVGRGTGQGRRRHTKKPALTSAGNALPFASGCSTKRLSSDRVAPATTGSA